MKKIQSAGINSRPDASAKTVAFTEHTLNNGLRLILSQDSSIPSVAINLCYHVGSKDEEPGQRGYAHLLEHLMFEGSENIPGGAYDSLSLAHGCENNAYTTDDKTNYYLLAPAHELEFGFWLESDRLLGLKLTEENIETQKGVVIEEKKQIFDNRPYGTVSVEFPPRLFKNSGYGWDTIGEVPDLENASLENLKPFYEKYYRPSNAVLSVVGDIDTDKTLKLAEKYFGSIPDGTRPQAKFYNEPPLSGGEVTEIADNIQLPGIFIAYRIPGGNSKESYDFDVLSDILSTGESSRLYKSLVYEKQLVSETGCWPDNKEFAGIFYIYAILMHGRKIADVQNAIDNIIDEVKNGLITDKELEKVKNRIETRKAYRLQTILSRADLLAHYKMFYDNADMINTNIEYYRNVTLESIRQSAKKYLRHSNRVILNYVPKTR